ncbi:MAG TPA: ABC transporter permease subunit, partial [Pyrinomonadaceae bacterium]|nr:ABC transporter permease subunit [Pyrinomonadaceae bacterium]
MCRLKRSLTAALLLLSCWLPSPARAQAPLRWGADPSGGAPYVFADPAHPDTYVGYEKEMVDALAAAMNRRPEFVPTDWETIVSALERGQFDIIVNGLEPTADRARSILFSKPYYIFQLQLTTRRGDTRVNSLEDCKKLTVGTLVNTAASRLLEKEGVRFRGYQDPVGAYRDLELRRLDAVLMDVPMEMFYARQNPRLQPAGEPFHRGAYVVGLRKGDEQLKREVDAAIDKIITDGTLERILRKWNLWNEAQAELRRVEETPETAREQVAYDITSSEFNWTEAIARLARAALVTILLAFGAMVVALLLGLVLAVGQSRGPGWLQALCTVYVEFFRGTPVLVQLLFLYFGLPKLGVAMPNWLTALVGLGLNYAAY